MISTAVDKIPGLSFTVERSDKKAAAKGFEAFLWELVLKEAFKTLPEGSFLNSKGIKDIYKQIIIWALSDYMSQNYDLGISKKIYEKMQQKGVNLDDNPPINIIDKKG